MIDAHQHFWHPARGDYGWIPEGDPILDRPYDPLLLVGETAAVGVTHTVVVQAAPSLEETEYLLGIADATPSVAGVVGWVDFEDQAQRSHLERLAQHPKFKGVRPMIQDIPDPNWMLRDNVQWAYQAIVELDLTFDGLGFPIHLENFRVLLGRYPNMRTVLDHCMKPLIAGGSDEQFQFWADGMTRLAEETHAFCKLSGMVTEASQDWATNDLRPFAQHVIEVFSPSRVMWGSDWPVCRLRCEYGDWLSAAKDLTADLSEAERENIFRESAKGFYGLKF